MNGKWNAFLCLANLFCIAVICVCVSSHYTDSVMWRHTHTQMTAMQNKFADNTRHSQHPFPLVGFEPTIWAGERPQTYALDGAAIGIGMMTVGTQNKRKVKNTK